MKVYLFNFKTRADPRGQMAQNSKLIFAVKINAPHAILEMARRMLHNSPF